MGFLEEFREMELDEEAPVAVMAYDSGTRMRSFSTEDYFEPSKFEGIDLVQAVTLEFTSGETAGEQPAQGDGAYTLFDDRVQLGIPAGEAWMDTENRLHIVIRDVRSARYAVTDFMFDGEADAFAGEAVMDWNGINYGWHVGAV